MESLVYVQFFGITCFLFMLQVTAPVTPHSASALLVAVETAAYAYVKDVSDHEMVM